MTTPDRADLFLADILAGPAELAAVLPVQAEAIRDVPLGALSRPQWRLVGMGSSGFAGRDVAARLRADGRDAYAHIASASGLARGGRDTLLVAVSASGSTPEVLSAVERHTGQSFVLGLTARADSPLSRLSDSVIPLMGQRTETAGISCLTFRATVAALVALTWEGDPTHVPQSLADGVAGLEELIAGRDTWLLPAADALDAARAIHVLGDGMRAGTAEQAALMFREAPRLPAAAFDTGDWLHVGVYTLLPGDPVLLLSGSGADARVLDAIRERGGRSVVIGSPRGTDGGDVNIPLPPAASANRIVRALVEPAVAELLAAELWRRASAAEIGHATPSVVTGEVIGEETSATDADRPG